MKCGVINQTLILCLACADINKFHIHYLVIFTGIFGCQHEYFYDSGYSSANRHKRVSFVSTLFFRYLNIYERDHKHVSSSGRDG
ncbi:hypothetical protein MC77_002165 [Citrobacter koseri]|nr:hypothetical protein MC77_002165 [Citrobacter koseri]